MAEIPDDWTPTSESINALPEPLRRYIHDLETICDPAGDVAEMIRLRQENKMLRWECERLAAAAKAAEEDLARREVGRCRLLNALSAVTHRSTSHADAVRIVRHQRL